MLRSALIWIDTVRSLGYRDVVVVCDRGYVSKTNFADFDATGLGFLLLLKSCDTTKSLIVRYRKKTHLHADAYMEKGMSSMGARSGTGSSGISVRVGICTSCGARMWWKRDADPS